MGKTFYELNEIDCYHLYLQAWEFFQNDPPQTTL